MNMVDYQQRKIFDYKWSKMTDEEKDQWIKDKDAEMKDIEKANYLKVAIENNLLSDDFIVSLLLEYSDTKYTKAVLVGAACTKDLVCQDELRAYCDL